MLGRSLIVKNWLTENRYLLQVIKGVGLRMSEGYCSNEQV
jgi:hypothetical protein